MNMTPLAEPGLCRTSTRPAVVTRCPSRQRDKAAQGTQLSRSRSVRSNASGHRAIDLAMEPIIDGLMRNPFGFKYFENNWVKFRYARTKPIGGIVPGLVVVFSIDENKNVILNWVEEDTTSAP